MECLICFDDLDNLDTNFIECANFECQGKVCINCGLRCLMLWTE